MMMADKNNLAENEASAVTLLTCFVLCVLVVVHTCLAISTSASSNMYVYVCVCVCVCACLWSGVGTYT